MNERIPIKDQGEQDDNWCYEHDALIDDCPVCLAEIEWPAQARTVQDVEHLASHQLTYPTGGEFLAAAMQDICRRFTTFRVPIPDDLL